MPGYPETVPENPPAAPGSRLPTRLSVEAGIALEACWSLPDGPGRTVVVLCHPHPLYGGTMQAPLLRTVAARLAAAGCPVLRFNFRGVGASTGSWGGGEAEIDDVAAAAAAASAAFPGLSLALAGWSFGAIVALRWQADTGGCAPFVGIAPPLASGLSPALPPPQALAAGRRLFVLGDRDQFTGVRELEAYAAAAGAAVQVLPGSDHFFFGRESRVADILAGHFAPAAA